MATVVGNVGTAITPTVETLTSTNTGATVEVNSGVKVIRVLSGVTVSGGNSVGTPGLTINGNGKAIVLQEGGNIVGGPGTTSNNYEGTGGQGAEAMTSNTTVKYIKTSGSIVGGGGGGGGPGKGRIAATFNVLPTWNSDFQFNVTRPEENALFNYSPYYPLKHFGANYNLYAVRNSLINLANTYKKTPIPVNTAINGADGSSGSVGSPGEAGGDGVAGSNISSSAYRNFYATNISTDTSTETPVINPNGTNGKVAYRTGGVWHYWDVNYKHGLLVNRNSIRPAIIFNFVAYNSYNYSGSVWNSGNDYYLANFKNTTDTANYIQTVANNGTLNSVISATAGGSGGQPGNAYNTTNTKTPFGS